VRKKKVLIATAMLAAVAGSAVALGACSLIPGTSSSPKATGTTIERILGHAPKGVAAKIARTEQIDVANDADYPPQSYEEDGKLAGFDVDVAEKVAELLGVQPKFVHPAWAAVPAGLKAGSFDVSIGSMTRTPDHLKRVAMADPYYYAQSQVVVSQGSAPLTTVAALKGERIGVGVATTYQTFLQAVGGVQIATYDTSAGALHALVSGRVDGVMTADLTAQRVIANGKPLQLSGQAFYYEAMCFATRRGEADLLALLDYAVKEMRANGSLTAMAKEWYGFDATQPPASGVPEFAEAIAQLTGQ
jgi:ABC-type amino acid transport substrate-binding protein